jgi:hypothetical protein
MSQDAEAWVNTIQRNEEEAKALAKHASKIFVRLKSNNRIDYYSVYACKIIAYNLYHGKTQFELNFRTDFGDVMSYFDLIKMTEKTEMGDAYAIREFSNHISAAFVKKEAGIIPYPKDISDKICAAISRHSWVSFHINGESYVAKISGSSTVYSIKETKVLTGEERRILYNQKVLKNGLLVTPKTVNNSDDHDCW